MKGTYVERERKKEKRKPKPEGTGAKKAAAAMMAGVPTAMPVSGSVLCDNNNVRTRKDVAALTQTSEKLKILQLTMVWLEFFF